MSTYYDTNNRVDYSRYVVHFTRERRLTTDNLIDASHPLHWHRSDSAFDRLKSIVDTHVIHGSPMPFLPNHPNAACFSECVWDGLVDLSDSYSSYGLVFNKRALFQRGGGPALYMRGDVVGTLSAAMPRILEPLVAPFDPYAHLRPGVPLDFLHEREWRVPGDFAFTDADIEFVIVKTITDATDFLTTYGSKRFLPSKIIPMEVYGVIRDAWGTTGSA